jgi:hypothetical protein
MSASARRRGTILGDSGGSTMFSPFSDSKSVVGLVVLVGPVLVFASFLLPPSNDLNAVRISVLELISMALGYLAGSTPRN